MIPLEGEHFHADHVSARDMDRLWADGWRHFGSYFFRYRSVISRGELLTVMPLRVDLNRFTLSRSQKRVISRNRDIRVVIRDACIDEEKMRLFSLHRKRFREHAPSSLADFMSEHPSSLPCVNKEIAVYRAACLIGVTFLDIGLTATSAVYAIFDPAESRRSPGIFMILESIRYSSERNSRFYYPGYAYNKPSAYDYKKRLSGLYVLDWEAGWKEFGLSETAL